MPQGDEILINRACQGDQDAFTILFEKYESHLYRYVLYLTGHRSWAEDIYQETWYRVADYFNKKKKVKNFKGWLFTIATNLFRDELRKKKIRQFFLGNDDSGRQYDSLPFDFDMLETEQSYGDLYEIREALYKALQKLTIKQRTIFILAYVHGYKIAHISEITGSAVGTIKATLHRTIKILRKELVEFK